MKYNDGIPEFSPAAQSFVNLLNSGKIDKKMYAIYLFNQHHLYTVLEFYLLRLGFAEQLPDLLRVPKILNDFNELWESEDTLDELPSTNAYKSYIHAIGDDPLRILSHLSIFHYSLLTSIGDLSLLPGSKTMYEFKDAEELKSSMFRMFANIYESETKLGPWYLEKIYEDLNEIYEDSKWDWKN